MACVQPSPRIAIVGAGPSGLTLGLLLQDRGIPFTIFELRQQPTDEEFARPSGMLDLHDESGIVALKECGLFEEFLNRTGECSEAQKVADRHGTILYQDDGEGSERPEISRHALTKMLIAHVDASRIRWGWKLVSATKVGSADAKGEERREIMLDFGPHGKQAFDLVVGADGAWSKIRSLLTDVKPSYSGTHNITLTIREVTKKYPHLARLVGSGSFSALADRHGVMSQRGPQDSARIYIFITTPDQDFASTAGIEDKTAKVAKDKILSDPALLGNWGSVMKELVTVASDEETADNEGGVVDIRALYTLPVGHAWEHQAGVTVIGDAAHLMCPWAGEGVNLAMWDSLLLAHAIIKANEIVAKECQPFQTALDPLMKDFEIEMAARAQEKAEETVSNGQMLFGEDGAKAFTEFFLAFKPAPEPRPE